MQLSYHRNHFHPTKYSEQIKVQVINRTVYPIRKAHLQNLRSIYLHSQCMPTMVIRRFIVHHGHFAIQIVGRVVRHERCVSYRDEHPRTEPRGDGSPLVRNSRQFRSPLVWNSRQFRAPVSLFLSRGNGVALIWRWRCRHTRQPANGGCYEWMGIVHTRRVRALQEESVQRPMHSDSSKCTWRNARGERTTTIRSLARLEFMQ